MDIIEAIKTRKSIRRFKSDPVTRDVLAKLLDVASRAPSAMNTQPWIFTVLAGDVLEKIKQGNLEMLSSKTPPNPEHVFEEWPPDSVYRRRQVELAIQLFQIMEIQREDKKKKAEWSQRGFRYFDAPAAIILSVDKTQPEAALSLNTGLVLQTICLAALNYNLGTCIEGQGVMYPEVLRKYADIPDSNRIISSVAIGYPDWDFPANKIETPRVSLESITTWCGF